MIVDRHIAQWRVSTKTRISQTLLNKINKPFQKRINDLINQHYILSKCNNYNFVIFRGESFYFNDEVKYYSRIGKGKTNLHHTLSHDFAQVLADKEQAYRNFKVPVWSNYLNVIISRCTSGDDLKKLLPSFLHGLVRDLRSSDSLTDEEAEQIKFLHQYGYQALCEQVTLNLVIA